jgi:hypothetical protein
VMVGGVTFSTCTNFIFNFFACVDNFLRYNISVYITLARFFYFKSFAQSFFSNCFGAQIFFSLFPPVWLFLLPPPQPLHFSNGPPLIIPYFNTFCLWKHHVNLYCSSDKFTWCFHKQKVFNTVYMLYRHRRHAIANLQRTYSLFYYTVLMVA